jgi:hypothetical protein
VFFYIKKIYDEIEKIIKKFSIHKNIKNLNYLNEEISCGKFISFKNKLKINYNLINKEKIKNILKKNSIKNKNLSFNNNNNFHSRNYYLNLNNFTDRNEKNNESITSNINNNNKIFYTIDEKNSSLYKSHMKIIKNNIEKTNKEINKKIKDWEIILNNFPII